MLQNQRTPDKNKQKNYGMSAQNFKNLPETIEKTADITKEQLAFLLATEDDAMIQDLKQRARNTGDRIYGKNVYIRGLIEFTNYCKNDCLYCGIPAHIRFYSRKESLLPSAGSGLRGSYFCGFHSKGSHFCRVGRMDFIPMKRSVRSFQRSRQNILIVR